MIQFGKFNQSFNINKSDQTPTNKTEDVPLLKLPAINNNNVSRPTICSANKI